MSKRTLVIVALLMCLSLVSFAEAAKLNEAPMLKAQVEKGELPPVEERLPKNPMVITPVERIGEYGGKIRVMTTNPMNFEDGVNVMGKEFCFRFNPEDGATIEGNIIDTWEFSPDGKELTMHIREGIKWSDGHPFTADDFLFWYEDVLLNDELTPVKPAWTRPGGKLMKMSKLDGYTIKLEFETPYSSILYRLASDTVVFLPKHYLSQFHIKYVDQAELDKRVKDAGFNAWYELFGARQTVRFFDGIQNPEAPVIRAFKSVSSTTDGYLGVRNPYYWKVDTEGNQLPYIDEVYVELIADAEMYTMRALAGQVDLAQWNTSLDNYPLYMEYAEEAGMRVLLYDTAWPSMTRFIFNMNHQDPVMRDIIRDKRLRIAMSLALNREEINEMVFFGMAEPLQPVILPRGGRFWNEDLAKRFTEYDPAQANKLLDEMGLDKRGADGFRLRPDGKPLMLEIMFWPGESGPQKRSVTELAKVAWEKIGIKMDVKETERSYLQVRRQAADFDMTLWHTGFMSDPLVILNPWHLVPTTWESGAPLWTEWYNTNGESGEEPPEYIKRLFGLWEIMQTSLDSDAVTSAGRELVEIYIDNLCSIGTVGLAGWPILIKENLRNVPEMGLMGWDWVYLSRYQPEQFFFDK
ncbi:MAG: ABC transporter substrate-binding protein [Firmicutes bacterium]|nr:ABC transporter substrate-binding protein [Bacillota bacterium]